MIPVKRQGPPKSGWEDNNQQVPEIYHDLLENTDQLEREWFKRTGIYPMHSVLVVKDSLLDQYTWLAKSLYAAFSEAKARYLAKLRSGEANSKEDKRVLGLASFVGDDPIPYGIKPNLTSIHALIDYAFQQKLIPRRMTVDELYADPEA